MLTRADSLPLSIAAATAIVAGLGFGAWAGLPAEVSHAPVQAVASLIEADDPNLAAYKQVLVEEGVSASPPAYAPSAYLLPVQPAAAPEDEAARLDAEFARQADAIQAQSRAWEEEEQAARPTPATYLRPETVTAAGTGDPGPDQAPPG